MLELKKVFKDYLTKNKEEVHALKDISFNFPTKGLIGILGESGCGKTTLLNLIGGIDKATSGEILFKNRNIDKFSNKELDNYRNEKVGFIFQDNNLVDNLTLNENVSLALSLTSIKKKEAQTKVFETLKRVKLENKSNKYPNELSGGEKQRATIARAIIKEPEIILADEPTGFLDHENSLEVMKLLKSISEEKLVIVVSHNEKLLSQFADLTLTLSDGKITEIHEINPLVYEEILKEKDSKKKNNFKFFDALKLAIKNIFFAKLKYFIVSISFALGIGSLGLVLSISGGFSTYLNELETNTLSGFPVSIESVGLKSDDIFSLSLNEGSYPSDDSFGFSETTNSFVRPNNLSDEFINYLESIDSKYQDAIRIVDSYPINIVYKNTLTGNVNTFVTSNISYLNAFIDKGISAFSPLPDNKDTVLDDYDILYGNYPENENSLALVLDSNNQISQESANFLGLTGLQNEEGKISFEKLNDVYFKTIDNNDLYTRKNVSINDSYVSAIFFKRGYELYNEGLELADLTNYLDLFFEFINNGSDFDFASHKEEFNELLRFIDLPEGVEINLDEINFEDEDEIFNFLTSLYTPRYLDLYQKLNSDRLKEYYGDEEKGTKLQISCVLRPKKDTLYAYFKPGIYYLNDLASSYKERNNPDFIDENNDGKIQENEDHRSNIAKSYESNVYFEFDGAFSFKVRSIIDEIKESVDINEYISNRRTFGLDKQIVSITIYPSNFEEKSAILGYIDEFNSKQSDENKIVYTDLSGIIFSNLETLISLVAIALILFCVICLIVSVLLESLISSSLINEKSKDIGILRSLGASTKNVLSILLIQNIIIGIISGLIGVALTLIVGTLLNSLILNSVNLFSGTLISFNPLVILLVFIASILIQLLSSLIPILKFSFKKPIDVIKRF